MNAMTNPQDDNVEIKYEDVNDRFDILVKDQYHGVTYVIRQFGDTVMEYIIPFENEVYTMFIELVPDDGEERELTETEVRSGVQVLVAGAHATIEYLKKIDNDQHHALAEEAIKAGEQAWGDDKVN